MKPKSNKFVHKIVTASLFILTYILLALPVSALTVSPAIEELVISPGQTETGTIKITANEEDTQSTYYLSSQNFEPRGESGVPYFTTTDEGLASWIKIQSEVNIGASGQTAEIPYTISIPADTAPGGYFASIFLGTQPPVSDSPLDGNTQVSIGGKVGILVLLRVAGDIDKKGGIIEFGSESGSKFFKNSPINFMYRFNNDGGDRVSPTGTITVNNLFGFEVDTLKVNEQKSNVLPGSIRKFNYLWGEEIEIKEDASFLPKLFATLRHQYSNFHFGYYTATLDLSWGFNEEKSDVVEFSFFVLPIELMLTVLILLVLLIFGIKSYNKWLISRTIKAISAAQVAPVITDEFPPKGPAQKKVTKKTTTTKTPKKTAAKKKPSSKSKNKNKEE